MELRIINYVRILKNIGIWRQWWQMEMKVIMKGQGRTFAVLERYAACVGTYLECFGSANQSHLEVQKEWWGAASSFVRSETLTRINKTVIVWFLLLGYEAWCLIWRDVTLQLLNPLLQMFIVGSSCCVCNSPQDRQSIYRCNIDIRWRNQCCCGKEKVLHILSVCLYP
jgi:hypothetical protein